MWHGWQGAFGGHPVEPWRLSLLVISNETPPYAEGRQDV